MKIIPMIVTDDGKPCETIEAARAHEILILPEFLETIDVIETGESSKNAAGRAELVCSWIVKNAQDIVRILTSKPSDKVPRKRRKDAGVPRKPNAAQ